MDYFYIRGRNCTKWKLRIWISIEYWPDIESIFEVWNFSPSVCCNKWKELWFLLKLLFVGAMLHKWSIRQTGLIWNFQFWFDPVLINKIEGYSLKVISYRILRFISLFLKCKCIKSGKNGVSLYSKNHNFLNILYLGHWIGVFNMLEKVAFNIYIKYVVLWIHSVSFK